VQTVHRVSRHTILVVDDDPQFRELYQTALRFRGFNVTTASDGLAALNTIDQQRPSLVILDLNMPCVDGWGVLRELGSHESTRGIPVIVVTGADVDKATLQAAAILTKPVLPEHVFPLIERQLRVA
jgi:two-component system, chemotaxis family, chemotaxis protein CheY